MFSQAFTRLLPMLCAGCIFAPAAASAGSAIYLPEDGGAPVYSSPYWSPAPSNYRAPYGSKQNLHLYLNAPGSTVRILDGGKQIVSYDRECRIHQEVVPSSHGPHRITVTRC